MAYLRLSEASHIPWSISVFCFMPHWVITSFGPIPPNPCRNWACFPPHWVPHPLPPASRVGHLPFWNFLEIASLLCDFSTPCGTILEVGTLIGVAALSCGCTKMVPASGTVPHRLQGGQGEAWSAPLLECNIQSPGDHIWEEELANLPLQWRPCGMILGLFFNHLAWSCSKSQK